MARLFFVSGPCGCGKSTFADEYARHLVRQEHQTVYVIHGDTFHDGFTEPEDKGDFFTDGKPSEQVTWERILRFNWDCIIDTAEKALGMGMDVVIDYVIETEMPRVKALAQRCGAEFYYIVLMADEEELEARIRRRGDVDMIERALFLKKELAEMPENQGHFFDNSHRTAEESVREIDPEQYRMC